MKKYTLILYWIFFEIPLLFANGFGNSSDSFSVINIIAPKQANQKIYYYLAVPIDFKTFRLNADGIGVLKLPMNSCSFLLLVDSLGVNYELILEPGYNLNLHITEDSVYCTGSGSAVNNFLLKVKHLRDNLGDSLVAVGLSVDGALKISGYCKKYKQGFQDIYEVYKKSNVPKGEVDYLLRMNEVAFVLLQKENYLLKFNSKEIDSLNLEQSIGLDRDSLKEDTLLSKHLSPSYRSYLLSSQRRYFNSLIFTSDLMNTPDAGMRFEHNATEMADQYSEGMKSYLIFHDIYNSLIFAGLCQFTDSLIVDYSKRFPEYHDNLDALLNLSVMYHPLREGNPAPSLQGITSAGAITNLDAFKGKVIFIDIWATWCSPCIKALPHIYELQKNFNEAEDVIFLFLSNDRDNDHDKWKEYLAEHSDFKGIHLRARKKEDRPLEDQWKVIGIPRYMIVGKDGKIVNAFAKTLTYKDIAKAIDEARKKR